MYYREMFTYKCIWVFISCCILQAKSANGKPSFLEVIKTDNISEVENILKNCTKRLCSTLLYDSVRYGSLNTTMLIVETGLCNVSEKDDGNGTTMDQLSFGGNINSALHHAARFGKVEIVEYLLHMGANIDAFYSKSNSTIPLHTALYWEQDDVIDFLLDNNATVGPIGRFNLTALFFVKSRKMLEKLFDYGADKYLNCKCDLSEVTGSYGVDLVSLYGPGETVLHRQMNFDKLDMVKFLVKNGADVNAVGEKGRTPLLTLIEKSLTIRYEALEDLINFLIEAGADLNVQDSEGNSTLHLIYFQSSNTYVTEENRAGLTKLLLDKGTIVNIRNNRNETPLYLAVRNEFLGVAKILIMYGADVNAMDYNNRTSLHQLASYSKYSQYSREKQLEVFDLLVEKGANIDAVCNWDESWSRYFNSNTKTYQDYGITPLHIASNGGNVAMVRALLNSGANISVTNSKKRTAFLVARNSEVLQMLLAHGSDINEQDIYNRTILHILSTSRHWEKLVITIMEEMLEKGANPNIVDMHNKTALHNEFYKSPSREGMINMTNLFLKFGIDINLADSDGETFLFLASKMKYFNVMKTLISFGADVNLKTFENNVTALHQLASIPDISYSSRKSQTRKEKEDQVQMMNLLLQKGADVNAQCYWNFGPVLLENTLHFACIGCFRNSGIAGSNMTPLHLASYTGNVEIIEILLSYGANVETIDSNGYTPLHLATLRRNIDVINILLDNEAPVDAVDTKGMTPLLLASSDLHLPESVDKYSGWNGEWTKGVKVFLEHGAQVEHRRACPAELGPQIALHFAVKQQHRNIVELLLDYGANASSVDCFNRTVLHYMSYDSYEEIVLIMKNYNINPNIQDINGDTALHIEVKRVLDGNKDSNGIRFLINDFKADVNIKNYNNKTVLDLIEEFCITQYKFDRYNYDTVKDKIFLSSNYDTVNTPIFQLLNAGAQLSPVVQVLPKHFNIRRALSIATSGSNFHVLEILLSKYTLDVNLRDDNNQTVLHEIAENTLSQYDHEINKQPQANVLQILTKEGANVNAKCYWHKKSDFSNNWGAFEIRFNVTPLHMAAYKGNIVVIEYLFQSGAKNNLIDSKEQTPLHLAALGRNLEAMELLLNNGSDVNTQDHHGMTPLLLATKTRDSEKVWVDGVKLLVNSGADVNVQATCPTEGMEPQIALHFAANLLDDKMIEFLLENGAEVGRLDCFNRSALHHAIEGTCERHTHYETCQVSVRILLDHGLNPNIKDTNGETALHLLAKVTMGQRERNWRWSSRKIESVLAYLIHNGADPGIENDARETPFMIIEKYKKNGLDDVQKILQLLQIKEIQ